MEIFIAVIELVLIFICLERTINDGLPDWIPRDRGGIDYMYRFMNVLGIWLLFMWGVPTLIGLGLLGVAYGVKKLFRKNRYGSYLN